MPTGMRGAPRLMAPARLYPASARSARVPTGAEIPPAMLTEVLSWAARVAGAAARVVAAMATRIRRFMSFLQRVDSGAGLRGYQSMNDARARRKGEAFEVGVGRGE